MFNLSKVLKSKNIVLSSLRPWTKLMSTSISQYAKACMTLIKSQKSSEFEILWNRDHILTFSKAFFFRLTTFFFQEQKNFVQKTTFVQFFKYCKSKKKIRSDQKFFEIFYFWKFTSKKTSERWDFNLCWFWSS